MQIHTIKTLWAPNELKHNTYVVEGEKYCFVVDAGCSINSIRDICKKPIEAVFITHGHIDHINYIEEYDKLNIPIYINQKTKEYLSNSKLNLTNIIGSNPKIYKVKNLHVIKDGDEIETSCGLVQIIYTSGHSSDSTCYKIEENLFSGDTLFSIAVGRTDLPEGNMQDLIKSLKLLDNMHFVNLYPGHGRVSTKQEQNNNIKKWLDILEKRM